MNYRVLPFDRVVANLRAGRYRGKIQAADYANTGLQPFDYMKFSMQLGRSWYDLQQMGLLKKKNFSGWNLFAEPTVEELESFREQLDV